MLFNQRTGEGEHDDENVLEGADPYVRRTSLAEVSLC